MKIAIFDLDGTITDSIYDLAASVENGLKILGYPSHTIEEYKKFVGNGAYKLCCRALPDDKKADADKLHQLFREYYAVHFLDNTQLYPDIAETIKTLSDNGVKLAVATNKPEDFAKQIVSKLLPGIEFTKVLGGCDERPKKPDPAIIRDILADFPDDGNTVFMIGDSNVDIQTAKNSGLISIGCEWGFRSKEELLAEGADYIISSAKEIPKIIMRY